MNSLIAVLIVSRFLLVVGRSGGGFPEFNAFIGEGLGHGFEFCSLEVIFYRDF